jgi:hypothetical protein
MHLTRVARPPGCLPACLPQLAEIGTLQLEFRQLSHFSGDRRFKDAVDKISHFLAGMEDRPKGLWPVYIDRALGHFSGQRLITFGGLGDSAYEYLLKGWLQTGKKEEWLWDMCAACQLETCFGSRACPESRSAEHIICCAHE